MSQFAQINKKLSIKQKFKNTLDSLTIHSCKIHKTEDRCVPDWHWDHILESNDFHQNR